MDQYGNEIAIKKYVKNQSETYKQRYRGQLKLFEYFILLRNLSALLRGSSFETKLTGEKFN